MQKQTIQWLIPVLLACGAAAALWYFWAAGPVAEPEVPAPPPSVGEPAEDPGPLHPVEPPADVEEERPELVSLPPLGESDQYLKLELAEIFDQSVEGMLVESGLIERVVATIDNLPRARVAERIRPIGPVGDSFEVDDGQDASGEYSLDEANYRRYETLVNMLASADIDEMVDLYRRYYPLFQKAYVNLGYPDGYFNDRLVEVIDHLLETPEVTGPVKLVRPHVLYEYEDPQLEALSSGQKMLLRMGTENAAQVKAKLRELREHITAM